MSIAEIRAAKVLDTFSSFDGWVTTRRNYVRTRIAEGWRVIHVEGSKWPRRFAANGSPDGSFLVPENLTETAMRYAESLANGGKP